MGTKCKFCGSSAYGKCTKSPHGAHEHPSDEKHCAFCGSPSYCKCPKSPYEYHKHGNDGKHCIWCGGGGTSTGACVKSPHKKHER